MKIVRPLALFTTPWRAPLVLLTTFLLAAVSLSVSHASFQDVPARDAKSKAIVFLSTLGVIEGYQDNTFRPDQPVSRAEFAKLLVESLKIRPELSQNQRCFEDVQTEWFAPYVCYAKSMEILQGSTPQRFVPNAKVTRAEAVKMTLRAFGLDKDMLPVTQSLFQDVQPSDWFSGYMHRARFTNLMVADGYMFPNYSMTRGGSAEILYRALMMQLLGDTAFDAKGATAFLRTELKLDFDEGADAGMSETTDHEDSQSPVDDAADQYAIFQAVLAEIQANHPVGKNISTKDFIYASIEGLAKESGDPYTLFLRPQESKEFTNSLNGELVGIGVEVLENELGATIMNVLPKSPALAVGVAPGDVVTHVGDKLLKGLSIQEIVQLMRGEKGTKVTIKVLRKTKGEQSLAVESTVFEFTIIRDLIVIPSVITTRSGTKSILKVTQFGGDTTKDLRLALEQLPSTTTGIVLDLRNNGGGYLDAAQSIAGFFLPEKSIAFLVELADGSKQTVSTLGTQMTKLPTVVLVNRYSASAAEVLAGALLDHGRATLMGETTFGKGTMQTLISYTDGSMLRMTIAKWLTPKGVSVGDVDGTHRGLVLENSLIDDPETKEVDELIEAALLTLP